MKHRNSGLLPGGINPIRYKIFIKPDLEAFVFSGNETVDVRMEKSLSEIVMHAKELAVSRAECNGQWAEKISYDEKSETVRLSFKRPIKKGRAQLKIDFQGVLNDRMRGFYRSSYQHKGKTKHLAVSQFEPTDARRAFPSFDEPAQKAVFEISLAVPGTATAVSNTLPAAIREHEEGYKIFDFFPSPKMSTYLVAFVVGDLEHLEGKTKDGVAVRVYTTPGKRHQGKFALDCAIKFLEFFNDYFGINYPLKTLDMIAVPDFAHGAMENWGAVTYRESALLVDEGNSSSANRQRVAVVIAHELAHQWFGNLVTMEWWTHLWLNEGFASYLEYLAVDHVFPQWDIWTQFVHEDLGTALLLDGLSSTHAVEIDVRHPDEIGEIFDEVSYSKGCSIIRMLAEYLGPKAFRAGLRGYLLKHAYGNASTKQLWQAFAKASGEPVEKIMRGWTSLPGYPVVDISTRSKNKKDSIKLSQRRFFLNPSRAAKSGRNPAWQVPIKFAAAGKGSQQFLLGQKTAAVSLQASPWRKANAGETGFFIVNHPEKDLKDLGRAVEQKKLPATDRLGLIRDLFLLAKAGRAATPRALAFLRYYHLEDNYTVWSQIVASLDSMDLLLCDSSHYQAYRAFALGVLAPLAKRMGWEKKTAEPHTQTLLRGLALSRAGYYGDVKTRTEAAARFADKKSLDPDLRAAVYGMVAKSGGRDHQDKFVAMYRRETLHEERNRIGWAIGSFRQPVLVKRALNFFFSPQVRSQDTPLLLASAYRNNQGRKQAWEKVRQNWPALLQRYGHGGNLLSRFIKPLSAFHDKDDHREVKAFFTKNPKPGAERAVLQTLEVIESNALWLTRDERAIGEFLTQNQQPNNHET